MAAAQAADALSGLQPPDRVAGSGQGSQQMCGGARSAFCSDDAVVTLRARGIMQRCFCNASHLWKWRQHLIRNQQLANVSGDLRWCNSLRLAALPRLI